MLQSCGNRAERRHQIAATPSSNTPMDLSSCCCLLVMVRTLQADRDKEVIGAVKSA